ncbi:unknown [Bacteroides sp. CAG:530]|nr:unknown [Bacteroides sp. CAG:530]
MQIKVYIINNLINFLLIYIFCALFHLYLYNLQIYGV